jgi:hypothetical protein
MSSGNSQDDPALQEQNLELRQAIGDAYAAIDSAKTTQTFAAITFEDLLDQQIERISGASTQLRPNALDRITQIVNNVQSAVTKIKALPPEQFQQSDPSRDVNSPP